MEVLTSDLFFAGAIMALGFLLMAIEFTILPGFGVIGLLGLGVLGYGCWELAAIAGPTLGITAAVLSLLVSAVLARSFFRSRKAKAFVLEDEVQSKAVDSAALDALLGKKGCVVSALRPSGVVEVEGRRYDAVARDGDFLGSGVFVEVVGNEHGQVRVAGEVDSGAAEGE